MATLTVTAQSGSPRIDVVQYVSGALDPTFLGLDCDSKDFTAVFYLDVDWFDVDGLRAGGTAANRPPVLAQPSDMVVDAGDFGDQEVSASDPDLQTLTLSLGNAPGFAFLAPQDADAGEARGRVHLNPRTADVGAHGITLVASDGALEDTRSFTVTVREGRNHAPTLPPISPITVVGGRVRREEVFSGDPDGGTLQLSKLSGPAYARLRTLRSAEGCAVGELRLTPSTCDVGPETVVIAVSDGSLDARLEIPVRVFPPREAPSSLRVPFDTAGRLPRDIALADLDHDGDLDAIVCFELENEVNVHSGDGTGKLSLRQRVASGPGAWALETADFNRDGHLDVAVTNSSGATVSVLLGNGDGTLRAGIPTTVGPTPHGIVATDLNSDGNADLLVSNFGGGTVSVLLGRGDGAFDRTDIPVGSAPEACTVADFNTDGRPDAAVTILVDRKLVTLLGTGSGALRPGPVRSFEVAPFRGAWGDWDWNGVPDMVVGSPVGPLATFRSDAAGGFEFWNEIGVRLNPSPLVALDFNQDAETDLAYSDEGIIGLGLFRGLPGGGFPLPPLSLAPDSYQGIKFGDMNGDGLADFVVAGGPTGGLVVLNGSTGGSNLQARGFLENGKRTVPSSSSDSRVILRLEPVNGSFAAADLDPGTVRLSRADDELAGEIAPLLDKTIQVGDVDRNGVPEIPLPFAREDWSILLADIRGREFVAMDMNASLVDGRKLCARFDVKVVGTGGSAAPSGVFSAAVSPNPLNPAGVIRLTTTRDGFVRIRVCDVRGRVVRSLLDAPSVTAGRHEILFDGRGDNGQSLASGVYFYQLETLEGVLRGRITILK